MRIAGFNFDNTYTRLPEAFYTRTQPIPGPAPKVAIFNESLAKELGLDFSEQSPEDLAALSAGNILPERADPTAQAYAGQQFGHFTMLGDGPAVMWGEHLAPDGRGDPAVQGHRDRECPVRSPAVLLPLWGAAFLI